MRDDTIIDAEVLEPEPAREPDGTPVYVTALTKPFVSERQTLQVTGQFTIAELLRLAGIPPGVPTRVFVNGDLVYPEFYHVVRPKRGAHVVVRVVPRGSSGGSGQSKNIGTLVVGILLIIVGIILIIGGTGTFGTLSAAGVPILMAGIGLALSGLINLLLPPPTTPKLRALAGLSNAEPESPTLSITGATNASRQYDVVPRILGGHKIFPPA
jgi:hypothetical protein